MAFFVAWGARWQNAPARRMKTRAENFHAKSLVPSASRRGASATTDSSVCAWPTSRKMMAMSVTGNGALKFGQANGGVPI